MASVNWQKTNRVKLAKQACHFDNEKREKGNHSNKDIDKEKTKENYFLGADDFNDVQRKLNEYINRIDEEHPPRKKQKEADRASLVSMEFVCPREITDMGRSKEFFEATDELLRNRYGEAYAGMSVHVDEVHEYLDPETKTMRLSCEHADAWVAADVEWKDKKGELRRGINGKNFETKKSLNELNKAFNDMCMRLFNMPYGTGDEPRQKSIEQLKQASYVATIEAEKEARIRLDGTMEEQEFAEQQLSSTYVIIENQQKQIAMLSEQLQIKEKAGREKDMEIANISNELLQKQMELQEANETIEKMELKLGKMREEANAEIKELKVQRDGLQNDISEIIKANQLSDDDVDDISNAMQDALLKAVKGGERIERNGYSSTDKMNAENEVIAKCMDDMKSPFDRLRNHCQKLTDKIKSTIEYWKQSVETAHILATGNIEVFTGYDGSVSEAGKNYIERTIRAKLDGRDNDEAWQQVRAHYRTLTNQDKEALVQKLKQKSIDYSESLCVDHKAKYVHKSKIDAVLDKSASTIGHGIIRAMQELQRMQEQYVEEEFER